MNHQNGSDKIQIVTSSSANVDVVINYILQSGVRGNDYVNITTATTTDITLDDSNQAQIELLSIKNIHASTSNTITVLKNPGTSCEVFKVTLAAGEILTYIGGKGWTVYTAGGKIKVETAASGGGSSVWGGITGVLSDQTDLQSVLDSKEDTITAGTTGQYWRGDKTWQTLDKTAVGLGNVVNADTTTTANITDSSNKRFVTDAQEGKIDFISITQPVDLDAIETRVNQLDAAVILKGTWDASVGTFPGSGTAQAGDSYIVSVAGTVDSQVFAINDRIIAVVDNASTSTFASNWFKADYTDQFLSLDGNTGAVTLGSLILSLTNKTTPIDNDLFNISDSADSNSSKKVTWANIKATLKTYLDTLYQPLNSILTQIAALSGAANDDIIQKKSGSWVNRTIAQVKTDLTLVKGDVGLGNVDNTSDSTKNSATATLTNKRVTPRTGTDTSSATPTINTDNVDFYSITAQAVDITSFTTNLSGTPTDGQKLSIAITGTATRAISWGASFENGPALLPTTTSGTNRLDVGFMWNSVTSKWRCMAQG